MSTEFGALWNGERVPGKTFRTNTVPTEAMRRGELEREGQIIEDPDDELGNDFAWTAYASSNNNISNDGWVSIAANPYDDDDLDTAGARTPRQR